MKISQVRFDEFIGPRSFEDDQGWSAMVWQHAWEAALEEAAKRFDTMSTADKSDVSSAQYLRKMKGE
jgi:hypothetical protein